MMGRSMANCVLLVVALAAAVGTEAVVMPSVPAIFVFGDSTADVGNNNFLNGSTFKANFPFNGIDFPGGVPTGRFSNGYNGIDFLARYMGFKQSPPPVLSIRDSRMVFKGGVSFASAGSGILDITGQNKSLSLNRQLKYMERTVDIISNAIGMNDAKIFLSKSIFIISTANNDMFGFSTISSSLNITKEQFIISLLDTFQHQLQRLYEMGARKFVVVGTTPLGCVPSFRRRSPNGDCDVDLNNLSRQFNKGVMERLGGLSQRLEGMMFSFADAYRVLSDVLTAPFQFGYKEVRSACCGIGRFNAESACLPNATFCNARKDHLFWDRVHPSEATYWLVARQAYMGNREFATPINIRQLTVL